MRKLHINFVRTRNADSTLSYHCLLVAIWAALIGSVTALVGLLLSSMALRPFMGTLSVVITLTAYAIYIAQLYYVPTVKPSSLSWGLFSVLTGVGAIVQIKQGGGDGNWCLIVTAPFCLVIALLSFIKTKDYATWNEKHAFLAFLALTLFFCSLALKNNSRWALLCASLATLADLVSYWPTFVKGRKRPWDDSATNYALNSAKCLPALLALDSNALANSIYLYMLLLVNGGFAFFLTIRRRPEMVRPLISTVAICFVCILAIPLGWEMWNPSSYLSLHDSTRNPLLLHLLELKADGLIGLMLAVLAVLLAEHHFAKLADSVTSRSIQDFPDHLDRLIYLISKAQRRVMILADCADYGSFRDFDRHDKLLSTIRAKSEDVKVDFLIWGSPALLSRANRYRNRNTRHKDEATFRAYIKMFLSKLIEYEPTFVGRSQSTIQLVASLADDQGASWKEEDGAPMNALKALLGLFHTLQVGKLETLKNQPIIHGDPTSAASSARAFLPTGEVEPELPELFFWVVDDEVAVFILPLEGEDAIAFETRDQNLIKRIIAIFRSRAEHARLCPLTVHS